MVRMKGIISIEGTFTHMPLEKIRNTEEEDHTLSSDTVRDLSRARKQVSTGKVIPLEEVKRRHGN